MTTPPTPPGRQPHEPDFEPPTFETFETPSFESISSGSFTTPEPPPPADDLVDPPAEPEPTEAGPPDAAPPAPQPEYDAPTPPPPPAPWPAPIPGPPAPPTEDTGPRPGNRTLIGYLAAVGALFVILVLILLYAFVFRDRTTTQTTSPNASASTAASAPTVTAPTPQQSTAGAPVGDAVDGPFTFSVTKIDTGTTVTSDLNEYLQKTATGVFVVVYLDVGNTGPNVESFLSTLQVLKADGTTFAPDDEASFYLGGGVVTVNPGEVVQTAIAFDVPDGTTPTSIELHGTPGGAGVEIPV